MLHLFRKHKSKGTPNGAPVTLPIDSKIAEALEEVEETTIRNLRAITKGANTVEQEQDRPPLQRNFEQLC